ncbi:MAG: FAD-dependent oxidoreductase, partial [Pseudomonadota bacterium]
GGVVGALQPHTPDPWNEKKQFQLESLLKARSFWPKVEAVSGLPSGYAQVGRVMPLKNERDIGLAQSRVTAATENWGDAAVWKVSAALDEIRTGWSTSSPTGYYVHDTLSAILHPRQVVASLAKAIQAKGGEIGSDGQNEGAVIWATGWQGLIDMDAGNGVKGQAAVFEHDASGAAQLYADGLHLIPHRNGTVAVGSTSEREFDRPDTTDNQLDDIIAKARALVPALSDAPVLERWAGVRPRAKSRAPLLGPWPESEGHFVANGGFKIGFGMAPKCAEVLVDLVLNGTDTIPEAFRTTPNS